MPTSIRLKGEAFHRYQASNGVALSIPDDPGDGEAAVGTSHGVLLGHSSNGH